MDFELELMQALQDAHTQAAQRENISTVTFLNALVGSGSYTQAVAAGMLTTGGMHAPVEDICQVLRGDLDFAQAVYLEHGMRVPGWGNSFFKTADESLAPIFALVEGAQPEIVETVVTITEALHATGKAVYPNIGCATAAVALALDVPSKLSPHLFIACRLPAWYALALQQEIAD